MVELHKASLVVWHPVMFRLCHTTVVLLKSAFSITVHCTVVGASLKTHINKASQAIQSPRTVPFFLLVSLLDGYTFPNVLVKGMVAFEH